MYNLSDPQGGARMYVVILTPRRLAMTMKLLRNHVRILYLVVGEYNDDTCVVVLM
jgi:hypothetical protein